jgi:hypothetical protein
MLRILVVFMLKEGSDCAISTTIPQQIGPAEGNPTIPYMLPAHVSYQ